jgi:hypothetical protein
MVRANPAKITPPVERHGLSKKSSQASGGPRFEHTLEKAFENSRTSSIPSRIENAIKSASQKHGVSKNLIRAVIHQESGGNPLARSSVGAQGLMQLMPATAKDLGVTHITNIEQNVDGGTKYLGQLLDRYDGNVEKALGAYNAGMGNVDKYGGVPPFKETQNYVKKIMASLGQSPKAFSAPKVSPTLSNAPRFALTPLEQSPWALSADNSMQMARLTAKLSENSLRLDVIASADDAQETDPGLSASHSIPRNAVRV